MDYTEHIDKLIVALCEYTRRIIDSDKLLTDGKNIAEITKALAELVSARASMSKKKLDEIANKISEPVKWG